MKIKANDDTQKSIAQADLLRAKVEQLSEQIKTTKRENTKHIRELSQKIQQLDPHCRGNFWGCQGRLRPDQWTRGTCDSCALSFLYHQTKKVPQTFPEWMISVTDPEILQLIKRSGKKEWLAEQLDKK